MIIPAPKKFQFPKIRKNAEGEWVSDESDEESSDDSSDDESDSSSEEESSDDDFY
jgi:hypothetical protein